MAKVVMNKFESDIMPSGLGLNRWFFESEEKIDQYGEQEQFNLVLIHTPRRLSNMNYPVYFENSKGERQSIGEAFDLKEAFDLIRTFLVEHNYKSYYTRLSPSADEWEIDVGSHSEFFYVSRDVVDNLHQP